MKRILFLLSTYPCCTETFIEHEITAIRRQGVEIQIFALRRGKPNLHDKVNKILYRKNLDFFECLKAVFSVKWGWQKIFQFILPYCLKPFYALKLFRNSFYIPWLSEWCLENQIEVIHAHFADMATDLALLLSQISNIPFTFSVHARDIFCSPLNPAVKCREASAVFACSRYLAGLMSAWCESSKINTICHGLDFTDTRLTEIYKYRMEHFIDLYSTKNEFKILAIGRLVPKKGFGCLIEALSLIRAKNILFRCAIIGGGPLQTHLQKLIKDYGLTDDVFLEGELPFDEICDAYRKSHLLIVPSVVAEDGDMDNIPNVILEAHALGVPVLASDLPAIREVIQPDVTGFLAASGNVRDLSEQIELIYRKKADILSILINARKQVEEKFDVNSNVKKMVDVWRECLDSTRGNIA